MSASGPQTFWVDDQLITGPASPHGQALLADAWQQRHRVLCSCQVPSAPMYVASVGSSYVVKRMPGTGAHHHRDCPSFEPHLAPFPGVDDTDPHRVALRVALPADHQPSRRPPHRAHTATSNGAGSLDLAGLLAYLWHEASLGVWSPKMEGKRHWGVVSWHLREAAHGKSMAARPLTDQLYVPAPFRSDRQHEHAQERRAVWHAARRDGRLLVVIGEAKAIQAATYGHRLLVKHLPDAPIYFDDEVHIRLFREHLAAVELIEDDTTGHPMVIAAVTITPKGHARAREIALLKTTPEWLPYRASLERRVLAEAVDQGRRFTGASYRTASGPATAAVPTLVLTDTAQPTAVHLSPPEHPPLTDSRLWVWEPGKPWPAVLPPQSSVPTPTPDRTEKERLAHG